MTALIALHQSDHYLVIRNDLRRFAFNPSEEFLGEIALEIFDPKVASSITLQISNCRFAMVSKEQFFA